jgi:catalase
MKSVDLDYSQRDLYSSIEKGNFPKWTVQIQVMPEAEAATYHLNPFDLTKVWPHGDYPVIEIGELELNRNPKNYFAEIEQSAFEPRNVVPGMGFSPDRMLQGRLISYRVAHRYRLGVYYESLPVNQPKGPYATYHRDGTMVYGDNGGGSPNYEPNSFGGPKEDPKYKERPTTYADATVARYDHRELDGDYYTQPGNLFRLLKPDAQQRLVSNIAGSLGQVEKRIQDLQINHFYKCDPKYGEGIAKAIGRKIEEIVKKDELVTA